MIKSKFVGLVGRVRRKLNLVSTKPMVVQTSYDQTAILVLKNEVVGQLIIAGDYEDQDIRHLVGELKPGEVFLDIGANVGLFSLIAAKKFPNVNVHAFEPIAINVGLINLSILLNGLENLTLNQTCVGNFDGEIEFSVGADSAFSSILDTGRVSELARIKSKIIQLDTYVSEQNLSRVDVMKIDVEGAEKLVILGASKLLSELQPRLILMELYDPNFAQFNTSIDEIVSLMVDQYGYEPYVLTRKGKQPFTRKYYGKIYNVFFEKVAK